MSNKIKMEVPEEEFNRVEEVLSRLRKKVHTLCVKTNNLALKKRGSGKEEYVKNVSMNEANELISGAGNELMALGKEALEIFNEIRGNTPLRINTERGDIQSERELIKYAKKYDILIFGAFFQFIVENTGFKRVAR